MYFTHITYTHYGLVHQDLGVWQDKRAAIAKTVDDLGDQFHPAMRAGCFPTTVTDNATPAAGPPVGQGTLVLPD